MCERFRGEAHGGRVARGAEPGHTDGWGIAYADAQGGLHHAGRSTADAAGDAAYATALEVVAARASGPVLAHVRKLTLGAKTVENTHPFIERGFAFAHNGTVQGFAAPGENDSRALFAHVLRSIEAGSSPDDALVALALEVDARHTYTSLTILMTDGSAVWGLRRVGNDPVACAPEACASDYYTLGYARLPTGGIVVSQEDEILGLRGWTPVADGTLLRVDAKGDVRARRVL